MIHNDFIECSRCHSEEALEWHTCPYAEEINDDYETECNCCHSCQHQCCMDI